jgi:hypothetical protein
MARPFCSLAFVIIGVEIPDLLHTSLPAMTICLPPLSVPLVYFDQSSQSTDLNLLTYFEIRCLHIYSTNSHLEYRFPLHIYYHNLLRSGLKICPSQYSSSSEHADWLAGSPKRRKSANRDIVRIWTSVDIFTTPGDQAFSKTASLCTRMLRPVPLELKATGYSAYDAWQPSAR